MTSELDRRLNAMRDDLADERLKGQVEAPAYRRGEPRVVTAPVADLLRAPHADAGLDTQLLKGTTVDLFDEKDGFAWVQGEDRYVGYIAVDAIGEQGAPPTHRVRVPRTFVYPRADMKLPRKAALSMGCRVAIEGVTETRGTHYALTQEGEGIVADHLTPVEASADDFVAVAEDLLKTPYLWGGASGFGIDCSGLVQLSLAMNGTRALRDTDMQARSIGRPLEGDEAKPANLRRGDLVFWKGHVAIVSGTDEIVHASGHAMMVTRESLSAAIERIGYLYGAPTGCRRLETARSF